MSLTKPRIFKSQPVTRLDKTNPVSTVWYEALPMQKNVRILGIFAHQVGTASQLRAKLTHDGIEDEAVQSSPESAVPYYLYWDLQAPQLSFQGVEPMKTRAFFIEARRAKVEACIIGSATSLECYIQWAKL